MGIKLKMMAILWLVLTALGNCGDNTDGTLNKGEISELPVGAKKAEAKGGGYIVAIGEVGKNPKIWRSVDKFPRVWIEIKNSNVKNDHLGKLDASLKKSFPSKLIQISFEANRFKIVDEDGDVWISSDKGVNWAMEKFGGGGSGTVGEPYQITSAAQLWLVREHLTNHFQLSVDIEEIEEIERD